jgi:hypothetical protein
MRLVLIFARKEFWLITPGILTILLDFSKAFDSVDHWLLCSKLTNQFAFSTSATSLIRSYLGERTQCVWVNNQASRFLPFASRVVQGLGPLINSGNPDMQLSSICRRGANLHQLPSFRICGLCRKNERRPCVYSLRSIYWLGHLNLKLFWWICGPYELMTHNTYKKKTNGTDNPWESSPNLWIKA